MLPHWEPEDRRNDRRSGRKIREKEEEEEEWSCWGTRLHLRLMGLVVVGSVFSCFVPFPASFSVCCETIHTP